jgi:hypothetical protein
MAFVEELVNVELTTLGITQQTGKGRYIVRRPLLRQ